MKKIKKEKLLLGPVITMLVLIVLVIVVSALFSIFNIKGELTTIVSGEMETSMVSVNNVFSKEGLIYLFSDPISSFQNFKPLVLIIISLIAISIGKASGLFKVLFSPLRRLKPSIVTFITLFLSIISTFFGDLGYIFLIPLIAVMYKTINRNAVLGVITCFIGITAGYATGLFANYNDFALGNLTQLAANITVDADYIFNIMSLNLIRIVSTLILALIGTKIIEMFLVPKIKESIKEKDESLVSKKGFIISLIVFVLMLGLILYSIVPGLPGSGILLDNSAESYMEKLFGENAPFNSAIIYVILLMFMVCGAIYGAISKNIKNTNQFSVSLSNEFNDLGYIFVLMFFASILVSVLAWTNLGEVIGAILISFIGSLEFAGLPLILFSMVIIILMTILIPDTITKWTIASPILVPLFMKSNITPDFTQFVFQVADSIGKGITPLFIYFIITLAFVEKYNNNEKTKVTVFGTLKAIIPTVLMFGVLWILIIIGWYVIGLPLGSSVYPTM